MDRIQATLQSKDTVALERLETLWLQLTGQVCNLACPHCYSGSSPESTQMEFMSFDQVRLYCEEAYRMGVRRIVLTGGEPLLHGSITEIINMARHFAPTVVMTNATLLTPHHLFRLKHADDGLFPVEFHVSLEGNTPAMHDRVRGPGSFHKALGGLELLHDYKMPTVIRVTKTWSALEDAVMLAGYRQLMRDLDMPLAKIRVQPLFPNASQGAGLKEAPAEKPLPCRTGRVVSSQGVHACPMRLEAWQGRTLESADPNVTLDHPACRVCAQSPAELYI